MNALSVTRIRPIRTVRVSCSASEQVNKVKKRVDSFKTKVNEIRARRIQRFKQVLPVWEESFLKEVDELEQAAKGLLSRETTVDPDTENPFKKE